MSSTASVISAPQAFRIDWLDSVRGLAIILVVLYHATLVAQAVEQVPPAWAVLNGVVQTFRMPLFFFASGLLAANATTRSWRAVARGRLTLYLWLYVLWSTIETLLYFVMPNVRDGIPESKFSRFVSVLVVPDSGVWYLYALLVFIVVAKMTARVPAWATLTIAGVISTTVTSDLLPISSWIWESLLCYLFFFLAGTRLKSLVLSWTTDITFSRALMLAAAFAIPTLVVIATDTLRVPGIHLTLSALAVVAGVAGCVWLTNRRWAGPFTYLGRLTLPIYVLHQVILNGLGLAAVAWIPNSRVVAGFLPPALTIMALAFCLLVHRLTRRIPGVYNLPRQLRP